MELRGKKRKWNRTAGSLASIVDIVPNSDTGCTRMRACALSQGNRNRTASSLAGPRPLHIYSFIVSRCGSHKTRMNVQISGMRRIV